MQQGETIHCALLPSNLASFIDFSIFVFVPPLTMTSVPETGSHSRPIHPFTFSMNPLNGPSSQHFLDFSHIHYFSLFLSQFLKVKLIPSTPEGLPAFLPLFYPISTLQCRLSKTRLIQFLFCLKFLVIFQPLQSLITRLTMIFIM